MAAVVDTYDEHAAGGPKPQPKHHKIIDSLRSGLASGMCRRGARLPSEAQLARTFKVGRVTVIKVVQQLEQEVLV